MTSFVTTSQLAEAITKNPISENAGRVALFHYIKSTCRGDEEVTALFINDFFAECMLLPHWQEKKTELYTDIKNLLSHFQFNLELLWDLNKMQLVHLQNAENLYLAVKSTETQLTKDSETFRIIPDGEHRMVVLRRFANGLMSVKTYSNVVYIMGKEIIPVKNDQELTYTPALELHMGAVQKLKLSINTQVRFEIGKSGILVQTLSGYAFRQSQMVQIQQLTDMIPLFFHLKRLEKFYVYRPSDPFYMQLVQNLDKAIQNKDYQARKMFEEAQIIFDQVFPDDKILFMKLKELAKIVIANPSQDLQG